MAFMLDTSAINRILDGAVGNEWPLRGDIFVTDIQLQEILDTPDPNRRDFLFGGLMSLRPNVIRPGDMFQFYDGSGDDFDTGERLPRGPIPEWYYASVPLSFGRIVPLIARRLPANRKRPENPLRDGFIAEAALLGGMTLVTADRNLAAEAEIFGVLVELIP